MYEANGHQFNFYVQREKWAATYAKVVDIEGVEEGEPIRGKAPYFENQTVYALIFNRNTNQMTSYGELPCAGTYGYSRIENPRK